MSKYEDFDLDLKVNEELGQNTGAKSTIVTTGVVISKIFGCTSGRECAMPTKNRPAASCHKSVDGNIQARC